VPLPSQDRQLRIVLASDLHLGYLCNKARFRTWVHLINAQSSDVVLLASGVSDHHMAPIVDQKLYEEFHQLKARFGVFAIRGNQEYQIQPLGLFEKYLQTWTNVIYLRDEVAMIDDSVDIVGHDGRRNRHRAGIAGLVADIERSKPVILVDHSPTNM
jgi:predicted MPP superfamily phosphohydrolase